MAIIRKGDKKAETELRDRAHSQRNFAEGITPEEQRVRSKKRHAAANTKISNKTGEAKTLSPRYRVKDYKEGGISGAAIAYVKAKETTVKSMPNLFTGVIEGGKLVKGGSGALERTLNNSRKNSNFAEGHNGARG